MGGGADLVIAASLVEMQGRCGTRFVNSQIYGDIIVECSDNAPLQFTACGILRQRAHDSMELVSRASKAAAKSASQTTTSIALIHATCTARSSTPKQAACKCEAASSSTVTPPVTMSCSKRDVAYANISDNTSRAPFIVINQAKGKTVIRDNLSET